MNTINKIKVHNLKGKSWKEIVNQFEIYTSEWKYFQSYNSTILFIDKNWNVFLDESYWNYSRTTSKYRNEFLWETTKETLAKIESWEYKLINLN